MPIYEYRCPDCGHHFEVMQKISADPITVCPSCSAGNVKKLISATSFVLKGGGWYKDHYGLKGSGGGDSGDAPAPSPAPAAAAAPAASPSPSPSPSPAPSSGASGSSAT